MIEVRPLRNLSEFRDAVRLQKEIWGFSEMELLPVRMFVVATKVGGQALGAFDGDRQVGFCLAIPGLKPDGRSYLHSHMLGVQKEYINRGIGRMLKLEQRHDALARGLRLIEWTFDPLEIKNAWFNIERLGAVVRRFVLNQYGTTSSELHAGMPTDRCVAEWWISSLYVEAVLAGQRPPPPPIEARISVPVDIARLRQGDTKKAREIQKSVSDQFLRHFENDLAVVGFEKTETAGTYLLGRWKSE
jgi:predicted GNAT superfamily acetyltransferase